MGYMNLSVGDAVQFRVALNPKSMPVGRGVRKTRHEVQGTGTAVQGFGPVGASRDGEAGERESPKGRGPVRAQSRVLCLSDNLDDEVLDLRTACRRDRSPSRGRHARVVVGPDPTQGLVARGHATDVEPFVLLGDVWLGGASSSCQGKSSPRVVLSAS